MGRIQSLVVRWWKRRSRRGKLITVGAIAFVLLALAAPTKQPDNQGAGSTPSATQTAAVAAATPVVGTTLVPATPEATPAPTPKPEAALRTIVETAFAGDTNSDKKRLRDVEIVPQQGGGWGVFVQFNADDNFTSGLTKGGIENRMRDGYKAIYSSGLRVRAASMGAWLDVVDQYGNESEEMVYKTILEGVVAKKVNWVNADILDWPDIWKTSILYRFLTQ